LEEILDRHEIADEDVESSTETLAKEYNKQDGASDMALLLPLLNVCHQTL
jgi:hypothetical protein